MVFEIDRLHMQFSGPKTSHYVQRISASVAFPVHHPAVCSFEIFAGDESARQIGDKFFAWYWRRTVQSTAAPK
jgi:hypothetical protein